MGLVAPYTHLSLNTVGASDRAPATLIYFGSTHSTCAGERLLARYQAGVCAGEQQAALRRPPCRSLISSNLIWQQ